MTKQWYRLNTTAGISPGLIEEPPFLQSNNQAASVGKCRAARRRWDTALKKDAFPSGQNCSEAMSLRRAALLLKADYPSVFHIAWCCFKQHLLKKTAICSTAQHRLSS
ncbi:hypothetical protein F441_06254 [Phytophthora nicotianae CJ01A1]|uniref:Uncharacterized protein n=4 Tax=Phytophthora nicotianae TaxID=4792 RepID=V9FH55_PHYNI|nr:hypothetical protein F443_06246 [Phytophthora nicotianae P1569]ETK90003.1 hypothetical protein L915_06127 [Phytophthora nicotianae]ETO78848.1 hypothetical protein F444_06311 [Phytophthora nicotianae P1976]ETP19902.1 hypothetical protein F441_06254 [Phytophthora nicotianae CJ01A1]ETL43407.1 hypothetical protein L916_06063 [Phytophthora nicotianae]